MIKDTKLYLLLSQPRQVIIERYRLHWNTLEFMKIGDRVRVKTQLSVFHHPEHKRESFDIKGLEGEVVRIHTEWHGRPISPNYPYEVRFTPRFLDHLGDHEIELVS